MAQVTIISAGKPITVEETTPGLFGKMGYQYASSQSNPFDQAFANALKSDPDTRGNTPEMLDYAMSTGDVSKLIDSTGKPFSSADQADAVSKATSELQPAYQESLTKDKQDTESNLDQQQRDYQSFLNTQGENFQADKTTLDQSAADRGVLFSGGRVQKERQLQESYARAGEEKKASVGANIGNTARDFGYKYGDQAAQGLGSFFNLGGNAYDAKKATGGITPTGLSGVYNANQGFYGTQNKANQIGIQQRATKTLANKGNKLLSTNYLNQIN